jgi:hypothetical protein
MANIQQAAKWMQEGKKVTRPAAFDCYIGLKWNGLLIAYDDEGTDFGSDVISADDLLAEDWEVVE